MKAAIAYADTCLDAWASWVRGNQGAWPTRTLLGRVMEEGVAGAASHSAVVESMPYQILRTDRSVARLEDRLKRTIKLYYLTHSSSEIKAAQLGVSRATFWRLLERAQQAVHDDMNGLDGETVTAYSVPSLQLLTA